MDRIIYLSTLYEAYKNLFTEKQKKYFEDYYYNDLSLSEIAENENVSRNAVHSQIKIVEEKLEEFENLLQLIEKKKFVLELVKNKISESDYQKLDELL